MSNFINSSPELTQCPRCKGFILQAHIFGWRTQVDATAIGLEEELIARWQGRSIYQLHGSSLHYLAKRSVADIQGESQKAAFQSHDCKTPQIFAPILASPRAVLPKEPNF